MRFCLATGKRCYTGPEAVAALIAIGKKHRGRRRMDRYVCVHCGATHLATHRDRRELAVRRERMLA